MSITVTYGKESMTMSTSVNDGETNSVAGLDIIGPNYDNYGQIVNRNFVNILENFHSKESFDDAIDGQIWFDSNDVLKIKFNDTWKNITNIFIQNNEPTISSDGNLYINTMNQRIQYYDNEKWNNIDGNNFFNNFKLETVNRIDENDVSHTTLEIIVAINNNSINNNTTMIIFSADDITGDSWIPNNNENLIKNSTSSDTLISKFPIIRKGVNINTDFNIPINIDDQITSYLISDRNEKIPLLDSNGKLSQEDITLFRQSSLSTYQSTTNNVSDTIIRNAVNDYINDDQYNLTLLNNERKLLEDVIPDKFLNNINRNSVVNNIIDFEYFSTNNPFSGQIFNFNAPTGTTKIFGIIQCSLEDERSNHGIYVLNRSVGTLFFAENLNINQQFTASLLTDRLDTNIYFEYISRLKGNGVDIIATPSIRSGSRHVSTNPSSSINQVTFNLDDYQQRGDIYTNNLFNISGNDRVNGSLLIFFLK